MNEATLTSALELLGDFLVSEESAPIWLVVGGGSALLVQKISNRQTKDVDVMVMREWEGDVVSAYPLPIILKKAAAKVAEELRLDANWLNESASLHGFDFSLVPSWFWQELDTREYGKNLRISFISRKGLILLKLGAALDRDQRRDMEDLASLKPTGAETEELLLWVLKNRHDSTTHPKLSTLLTELGHADLISKFP
jgi:hypothetical protein